MASSQDRGRLEVMVLEAYGLLPVEGVGAITGAGSRKTFQQTIAVPLSWPMHMKLRPQGLLPVEDVRGITDAHIHEHFKLNATYTDDVHCR